MSPDSVSGPSDVFMKFGLNDSPAPRRKTPDVPFNILVLAPLSGSKTADGTTCAIRRIDADNYAQELQRIAPVLTVDVGGEAVELTFRELEDFEPDRLLRRVPALADLLRIRKRLREPGTAADARAEALRTLGLETPSAAVTAGGQTIAPSHGESFADLLNRPVEKGPGAGTPYPRTPEAGIAGELIRGIVTGSSAGITPSIDNSGILAGIEAALHERLGHILHDPAFQALEATWRGVDFLMTTLETDEEVRLYVMDVCLDTLREGLMAAEDLRTTRFCEAVTNHEGVPWSLLIGDYTFDSCDEDVALLGRLGIVAMSLGAPFVSGASCRFAGVTSLVDPLETRHVISAAENQSGAWVALRGSPVAPYIGLTFPRVIMRLPYGGTGEPIDAFDYDEMAAGRDHHHYLWGCGAYLCGYVYGRSFQDQGAQMDPRAYAQVSGLPSHAFSDDGERSVQPCAETWLSESLCQALAGIGLFPLASVRNRDAVQLTSLTSIAYPATPLEGRWC